ncbi:MAG: hypothetical protein PHC69_08220 [Ruminiclostridium sp.]|nr:hypothetical protein [Ruminiclostridium sp.]
MDDKIFDLMEKMYVDLKNEIRTVGNQVAKVELIIENDVKPDIKIALERYQAVSEKLTTLEQKIDNLTAKVENHDIEIAEIKGGKRRA